ncbi:hypothetical protein V8G54_011496, partial [Vigna mungo]
TNPSKAFHFSSRKLSSLTVFSNPFETGPSPSPLLCRSVATTPTVFSRKKKPPIPATASLLAVTASLLAATTSLPATTASLPLATASLPCRQASPFFTFFTSRFRRAFVASLFFLLLVGSSLIAQMVTLGLFQSFMGFAQNSIFFILFQVGMVGNDDAGHLSASRKMLWRSASWSSSRTVEGPHRENRVKVGSAEGPHRENQ